MPLLVSRTARSRLELGRRASFTAGKLELSDLAAARSVSRLLRGAADAPSTVSGGELFALSRLEAVFALVVERQLRDRGDAAVEGFLRQAQKAVGREESERLLALFSRDYSLPGDRRTLLRELIVWWAVDDNPAASAATDLLHEGLFRSDATLRRLRAGLEPSADAAEGGGELELLERLRRPALAAPGSLADQLRWVLENWGEVLSGERTSILRGLDLLAEEAKRFTFALPGPGPVEVPAFSDLDGEPENYSPDEDWMPGVALLAKNVFVWLDQLSKRFERPIRRLDEVPDQVLDEIAGWGFTGLWLIGVWERSAASERLKRLCGNPEAVASAYSLRAYRIAAELGGDEALADFQRRALERGIRLGSDMVPNHLGLDSDWLLAHPERFLSLPESPFAAYTFDGPDLSPDPEVGIFVEDHYFDRSDAAVVFKRVDRPSGEVRYVYHGNDGTTMPWNDTAQLDYLNPETREAVIETILEVARRFPLIRFDAAMTLARRHYQRLWFPAPGSGGAVPSRAEHGLEREAFARRMPEEFWREVVERVASEAPDTLLLAEAFWLMEGYFVRTLGMHRVYNSAFMNMLRDRENAKYRRLIKETLIFDPRILQRYVNFLTNPDERTAVDQFGSGDRYFGACVLLATLPGLPMFGHGQIEGLGEKYGMEYRRAYREEAADREVVARHEREIVPLLAGRAFFAGVERFELYDFVDAAGAVNEDVIAYSNAAGGRPVVVVFNNTSAVAAGALRRAAPKAGFSERSFAEAAGLHGGGAGSFWVFRDRFSSDTHLRPAADLDGAGLALELGAYACRVFEDFRLVAEEADGRYGGLWARHGAAGIGDLEQALADLELEPAARGLADLLARPSVAGWGEIEDPAAVADELTAAAVEVLRRLPGERLPGAEEDLRRRLESRLRASAALAKVVRNPVVPATPRMRRIGDDFVAWLSAGRERRAGLCALEIVSALEAVAGEPAGLRRQPIDDLLGPVLETLGGERDEIARVLGVVELARSRGWCEAAELPGAAELRSSVRRWVGDPDVRALVGFEEGEGGARISRSEFADLLAWRLATAVTTVSSATAAASDREENAARLVGWLDVADLLRRMARRAGYRVDAEGFVSGPGAVSPAVKTRSE